MTYVIVEGADGVGKTSIARRVSKVLDLPYHHFSSPEGDPAEEYLGFIEENESGVLDRSWLGELVYGPIWRNTDPTAMWKRIERKLRSETRRTFYVLIHSSETFGNHNSAEVKSQHEEVSNAFLQAFRRPVVGQRMAFNVQNFKNLEHELIVIPRFAKQWLNRESVYAPFVDDYTLTLFNSGFRFLDGQMRVPTRCTCPYFSSHQQYGYYRDTGEITWGAGSLKPKHVLVGEAPGWKGCGRTGIPFYNDRSGMLFRDAVFWSGLWEGDVYITNGLKCNPPNNKTVRGYADTSCVEHLQSELTHVFGSSKQAETPPIWAVGRKPEELLKMKGWDATYLLHPAAALRQGQSVGYWREFYDTVILD